MVDRFEKKLPIISEEKFTMNFKSAQDVYFVKKINTSEIIPETPSKISISPGAGNRLSSYGNQQMAKLAKMPVFHDEHTILRTSTKGNSSTKMTKAKMTKAKTSTFSTKAKKSTSAKANTSSTSSMAKAKTSTNTTKAKKKFSMQPLEMDESVNMVKQGKRRKLSVSKPKRGCPPGTAMGEHSTTGKRRKGKGSNSLSDSERYDPTWRIGKAPPKKRQRPRHVCIMERLSYKMTHLYYNWPGTFSA